jgi:MYXO-CTERM domain-containing protein
MLVMKFSFPTPIWSYLEEDTSMCATAAGAAASSKNILLFVLLLLLLLLLYTCLHPPSNHYVRKRVRKTYVIAIVVWPSLASANIDIRFLKSRMIRTCFEF